MDRAVQPIKIKALHCVAGNLYGGVEVLLTTVARSWNLVPELEPEFAVCFEGRLSNQLRDAGAAVHMLGDIRFSRPWTILNARRRLRSVLNQPPSRRPDLPRLMDLSRRRPDREILGNSRRLLVA